MTKQINSAEENECKNKPCTYPGCLCFHIASAHADAVSVLMAETRGSLGKDHRLEY